MRSFKSRRIQAGYLLFEFAVVMILAGSLMLLQFKQKSRDLIANLGTVSGQQIKTVSDGLNAYAVTNYAAVINNTAVPGVAVTRTPTIAELRTLGFLPTNFNSMAMNGTGYTISLTTTPPACVPPSCNIDGYVVLSSPYLVNGRFYPELTSKALLAIGSDGAASTPLTGTTLRGINASWSIPNPITGTPVGIIGARVGSGTTQFAQFLRTDGGNQMQTAIPFSVASKVTMGNACAPNGQLGIATTDDGVVCKGGTWKKTGGGVCASPPATYALLPTTGNTVGDLCPVTGLNRVFLWSGASWLPVAVDQNGDFNVPGNLTVGGDETVTGNLAAKTVRPTLVVAEGSSCAGYSAGAQAQSSTTSGLILSCQSGVWRKANGGTLFSEEGAPDCIGYRLDGSTANPYMPGNWAYRFNRVNGGTFDIGIDALHMGGAPGSVSLPSGSIGYGVATGNVQITYSCLAGKLMGQHYVMP